MANRLEWKKLVSTRRIGKEADTPEDDSPARTDFHRDYDRVVFSSSFRRLQDKTQVFPLSPSDYVRKRLTHSIETSCVGRTLAHFIGGAVAEIDPEFKDATDALTIGTIVSAACLAHDIGNPPFGHSGEDSVASWFKAIANEEAVKSTLSAKEIAEFLKFEGNAQGFRILTRLQFPFIEGGLRLTCATLAAFTKYPREAVTDASALGLNECHKKFGFFQSELKIFEVIATETGLFDRRVDGIRAWCRHPLAYVVEGADDITYRVVDLEDAYRLGHISFAEALNALLPLMRDIDGERATRPVPAAGDTERQKDYIEYLRAKAINSLTKQASEVFVRHYEEIMTGNFQSTLIQKIEKSKEYEQLKDFMRLNVYNKKDVLSIELAGYNVIGSILDELYTPLVRDFNTNIDECNRAKVSPPDFATFVKSHGKARKLVELVPGVASSMSLYERIHSITDFVSGMTDSYAIDFYKRLNGLSN